ncbi:MAG: dehydrogenase [Planctomycetes bacterium]|nr:dehydrogenase [Planctomycetota bacterium]
MMRLLLALVLSATLASPATAQRGDKRGEAQPDPPSEWKIPPAPVLSPKDAQAAFRIADGFRIELVAAEPLVEDPVCFTFDADGRLWVAEMRTFMPNVDGENEAEQENNLAILEDKDGDGVMDTRHDFADGLLLPRALTVHQGGALFIEPPYLRWFKDIDGDDEWDKDAIVSYGFGGIRSVEHAPNGLVPNVDNWVYLANHPGRFRFRRGKWEQQPTGGGGQWGIAQDDWGRLFFNSNSQQLRGTVVPSHYTVRNPNLGRGHGADVRVATDERTWPARITPGVNRGYRKGTLRKDGRLARFTAACGPTIYRGGVFGEAFQGNAFVCEPSGNLIKRDVVFDDPKTGAPRARPAYIGREFLTSTDERFRPVNLMTGPDGCLYVCDLYRGILQHRIYVTSYLRKQILKRALDKPLGLGRIWRIVPESYVRPKPPRLSKATPQELVHALRHQNGWWRDTAQRLLVERQDRSVVPELRATAVGDAGVLTRLHALWTLEGLHALDETCVLAAIDDPESRLRAHGLRLAESLLAANQAPTVRRRVLTLASPSGPGLRRQLLFTLGELATPAADAAMERTLRTRCESRFDRDAAVSGLWRRELEFARRIVVNPAWSDRASGRPELLRALATCVTREEQPERVRALIALAAAAPEAWQRHALLGGVASTRPKPPKKVRPLRIDAAPAGLPALKRHRDTKTSSLAQRIAAFTTWPGKHDWERLRLRPLSSDEKALFDVGRQYYTLICQGCHQQSGRGLGGLAPPLAGSEWVSGPISRLVRILHHGVAGPIDVAGKKWDLQMPGLSSLTDEHIAGLLTYIRRSFGHESDPVPTQSVTDIRKQLGDRKDAWSAEELLAIENEPL